VAISVLSDAVWVFMVLRGVVYGVVLPVCIVNVCVGEVVCIDSGLVTCFGVVVGLDNLRYSEV